VHTLFSQQDRKPRNVGNYANKSIVNTLLEVISGKER